MKMRFSTILVFSLSLLASVPQLFACSSKHAEPSSQELVPPGFEMPTDWATILIATDAVVKEIWNWIPEDIKKDLLQTEKAVGKIIQFLEKTGVVMEKVNAVACLGVVKSFTTLVAEFNLMQETWELMSRAENVPDQMKAKVTKAFSEIYPEFKKMNTLISGIMKYDGSTILDLVEKRDEIKQKLDTIMDNIWNLEIEINGEKRKLVDVQNKAAGNAVYSGIFTAVSAGFALVSDSHPALRILSGGLSIGHAAMCFQSTRQYFITAEMIDELTTELNNIEEFRQARKSMDREFAQKLKELRQHVRK